MPRDQKPRRSNEENNDDDNDNDNYNAIVVLIASILFLFFAFGTSTVLHKYSSTLHKTERRRTGKVCNFKSALPVKQAKKFEIIYLYL